MEEKNKSTLKNGILLYSKMFWLIAGFLVFIVIAFVLPVPESQKKLV